VVTKVALDRSIHNSNSQSDDRRSVDDNAR
jgi:hypothetical protein